MVWGKNLQQFNAICWCPGEWRQFGSYCVIFDETPRSWSDAEFHCQSLGGHLASVHSWLESIFLEALTFDLPLTWIGGTDGGQPQMTQYKSWSWTDGSGFNYQQWAEGMPNNSIGGESCIQMNFGGHSALPLLASLTSLDPSCGALETGLFHGLLQDFGMHFHNSSGTPSVAIFIHHLKSPLFKQAYPPPYDV
ncbi:ladderlectin-like isoform X2 [Esox lucius]|uniref:ladderlectin-like isoform X2 n=1 Tax=Esox lucius TaxID=8010 RepID=UPI001476A7C3|nr:ladderlectin-like isoform X2 [Esox lucius]